MTGTEIRYYRRSIRLRGYDYTQEGAYVVTICAYQRSCLFGEISSDGEMSMSEYGRIVEAEWLRTSKVRPYVALDEYVVMPNHFHGILCILKEEHPVSNGDVGAQRAAPLQAQTPLRMPESLTKPHVMPGSIGAIVRSFKSAVTKRINAERMTPDALVWQRNYYEQIIRDEPMLDTFRKYIQTNPARWADDRENPANKGRKI